MNPTDTQTRDLQCNCEAELCDSLGLFVILFLGPFTISSGQASAISLTQKLYVKLQQTREFLQISQ